MVLIDLFPVVRQLFRSLPSMQDRRLAHAAGVWWLCLSAGVVPSTAQPAPAPLLSLDAAVTLARQQNRALHAERLELDKADQEVIAFRTQRRPLFDVKVLSGSLVAPLSFRFPEGVFGSFPVIGGVPPSDTTITTNPRLTTVVVGTVMQPLTQLRRIGFGESAHELGRQVAAEQVRAREAEIDARVKKAYYGIVQAEAALRAREDSVRLYRELARLMDQYAAERTVLPAEALSIRAAVLQHESDLNAARRAAKGYREQLNAVLGRDLDEGFSVEPLRPTRMEDTDLPAAEAQALASRPEVRIKRLQSEQAGFDLKATETPGMPEISVAFNYVGFYGFELLPHHGALVGVLGSWQPWDWGRKRAEREGKRLTHEQSGLAVREAEELVRVDVRARFRDLQEAFDRVPVCEALREAARERLRVATERFGEEAALERELLEAQAGLAQSEYACQQALAGYWTARAELERARADQ
jgi:outer membrane protein TolC